MSTLVGTATTKCASQYLVQLCKHWSHRFESTHTPSEGVVSLPFGRTEFKADGEALLISVADPTDAERARTVIAEHLNRFAFREGPLAINWSERS